MATTSSQRCCVCGKDATARCERCASNGVHVLYCSREHQKLVWPAHKRFCGKNPLNMPLLTAEEARTAKAKRKVATLPGVAATSLNSILMNRFKLKADEVESFIDSISADSPSATEDPARIYMGTCLVRTSLDALVPDLDDTDYGDPLGKACEDSLAVHSALARAGKKAPDFFGEKWWIDFHQISLNFHTLLGLYAKSASQDATMLTYAKHALATRISWAQVATDGDARFEVTPDAPVKVREAVQQHNWDVRNLLMPYGGRYNPFKVEFVESFD